jgi:hypothetical protein
LGEQDGRAAVPEISRLVTHAGKDLYPEWTVTCGHRQLKSSGHVPLTSSVLAVVIGHPAEELQRFGCCAAQRPPSGAACFHPQQRCDLFLEEPKHPWARVAAAEAVVECAEDSGHVRERGDVRVGRDDERLLSRRRRRVEQPLECRRHRSRRGVHDGLQEVSAFHVGRPFMLESTEDVVPCLVQGHRRRLSGAGRPSSG